MIGATTDQVLDGHDRGFPAASRGLLASEVGVRRWHLARDFETPIATIREDHVLHNAAVMRRWCAEHAAELWPHAKTVMSPELIALQLEHGATGLTAATAAQARLLLEWGAPRVFVANQLVQPTAARDLARWSAERGREVLSYVDSAAGVRILQAAASEVGAVLPVVLELGAPGARSGIRSPEDAAPILEQLRASAAVHLVGVAGYEGSFGADRSGAALERVDGFLRDLGGLLRELVRDGAMKSDRPVFSAGGSMYFDRVELAARDLGVEHRLVIRSGCYLLHDVGLFAAATPLPDGEREGLRAALSVWGTVHSRPEPTMAYLDIGRRDVGFDQGLPVPQRRLPVGSLEPERFSAATAVQLNDQHLHVRLPADSPVGVGDRIEFGVSHPCTTMDKWRTIAVVDEPGAVVGAVTTRF